MKKNMYLVMLATLVLAGCSNELGEQPLVTDGRVPLQLDGNINMLLTRAADDHFDENDAIGVYMVDDGNAVVSNVSNYRYITVAGGKSTAFAPIDENNTAYFPENGDAVNVVAYYPQSNVADGKLALNLANQDEQPKIDLMAAKITGVSKDNPAVSLQFTHRLTKLFFEITTEGDITTDGMYAAIGSQYTDIRYDVLGDVLHVAEGNEKQNISMKYWNLGGYCFLEAIVLPNEMEDGAIERELVFRLANGTECKAKIDATTVFEKGKKYKYNVKFTKADDTGNVSATISGAGITNWEDVTDDTQITVNPEKTAITEVYITGSPTGWGSWRKMTQSNDDEKILTWTGTIMQGGSFKFTLDETYDEGKYQLMSSETKGVSDISLVEGEAKDVYKVLYQTDGADTKWTVGESSFYMVTLNVETMKVSVEKRISLLGLNGSYDQEEAPFFTKTANGIYELQVEFTGECSFSMPLWKADGFDMDCYMPAENVESNEAAFVSGDTPMKVVKKNRRETDHQWKVTTEQIGTYKLVLDISDTENMTLTATKVEQ